MQTVFARNFIRFSLLLAVCVVGMGFILVTGHKQIDAMDDKIRSNNAVISEAQNLATLAESMLGSQRGYLLTPEIGFLDEYTAKKDRFSQTLAELTELAADNPSQTSRISEIRNYFNEFTRALEAGSNKKKLTVETQAVLPATPQAPQKDGQKTDNTVVEATLATLNDAEIIRSLKSDISRTNNAILAEENELLQKNLAAAAENKDRFFGTLILGGALGTVMLLIFNTFMLQAQSGRDRAEESLKDTEQRLALAIEGTNDGIFDWNLKKSSIFYSARFFKMLGYDRSSYTGTIEDFTALLHPEEVAAVRDCIERYLAGELDEYSQIFRMKDASGKWLWIQSRGMAVFDDKGHAVRMVGAHSDITYMIEYQEMLEADKKHAEQSNRAKSDFLAHMSHEIRTPLTAISGIAEIFERNQDNLNEKQQKLVRVLNSSSSNLKDLVNDILDFAKIENRELELEQKSFSPSLVFEDIISMMAMRANEKGLSFVFDYKDIEPLTLVGDPLRMRQILVNLIGNAVKFTEKGGISTKASIEHHESGDNLRIDVSDTGIGIGAESFDLIFERFKQGDASISRKYGGTGLGLPISKNLAHLMHGDIIVSSEKGKGSVFSLIIPLRLAKEGDTSTPIRNVDIQLNDRIRASMVNDTRILIAEDYEGNIAVLGYMMDDLGCAYDIARTGAEAVNLWKKNSYSLILMDIQMPEMDGFTATANIRRVETEKDIPRTPIIGMTAHALIEDEHKCIEAGMDDYLSKPIDETSLKTRILKHLNRDKEAA